MDFYDIRERKMKNGVIEIYPDFRIGRSSDLMVRGRVFYAIWDQDKELWSTDMYDVQKFVDRDLRAYLDSKPADPDKFYDVKYMQSFSSSTWLKFQTYCSSMTDSLHQLDDTLTFMNSESRKQDYVSKKLPYSLEEGDYSAYDKILGTLYEPEERAKLEWAIGAIVSGDSRHIQKFLVLYGEAGSGKSTVLNIVQKLFPGYYTAFEARALTSSNNAFSTEVFRSNPLVAVQHDGDLSKIEDNTKLNSIVSHEEILINEKYKASYMSRMNCFLFMASNRPVKITDAKSGIIRRLIDVKPSGNRLAAREYQTLMGQIDFELGAIAAHCLAVYREMGQNYYSAYRPVEMILQTDVFYNFVESAYYQFKEQDGVSLLQAYTMYKAYCDDTRVGFTLPRYKFREELRNYFEKFEERTYVNGERVRSYYSGFLTEKFKSSLVEEETPYSLVMEETESNLDILWADQPAQYANDNGTPCRRWDEVTTKLSDIDTSKLHYVKPPQNHIVIDFDLRGDDGEKSAELNVAAASSWPATYSEYSKSGKGIHLHYVYEGDVATLSNVYSEGIEVKTFKGNSSLRRQFTKANNVPIATINSGLPIREPKVINWDSVRSEKKLRELVIRNLGKEIHPGTKPSIDFIKKILDDAYSSGLPYDLTDMRMRVLSFASNSTNQAEYCLKTVSQMKFKSDDVPDAIKSYSNDELVFYDVEVFKNLFVICWKAEGEDKQVVKMINPSPNEVELLMQRKLVGFNCRRYDNHILYAALLGYNNLELYNLSQKLVDNSKNAYFSEASQSRIRIFTTSPRRSKA